MKFIKNKPVSPTPCSIITYTMKKEQNLHTLELCFDISEGFNIQSNLFILAFSVGICDIESTLVANDFTPSPINDRHVADFETMQERRRESMVASKMSFFPRVNENNGIPFSRPIFYSLNECSYYSLSDKKWNDHFIRAKMEQFVGSSTCNELLRYRCKLSYEHVMCHHTRIEKCLQCLV